MALLLLSGCCIGSGVRIPSSYRPEIDGLRAVAVVAVVIYHMNPVWLPGGFLGVDVFFVISGYLITMIVRRELASGEFSIRRFYERRARRILPALIVVLAACTITSWYLLDATEMRAFGQSLLAQLAFASNFLFWHQSGYFSAPAEMMPLLHTWSLAVEEQFYVFFPVFTLVCWRYARRYFGWVILGLALLSLYLAHKYVHRDPSGAFYLLPFRGWELLAGAWLAQLDANGRRAEESLGYQIAGLVGLGLVVISFFTATEVMLHPSVRTVPLILGVCLIVRYGHIGVVQRVLALRPVVGVGLISYSLYLWHWPLLVFIRQLNLGQMPPEMFVWFGVVCLVAAWASWRFVEKPARDRLHVPTAALIIWTTVAAISIFTASISAIVFDGFPGRMRYPSTLEATFVRDPSVGTCLDNDGADEKADGWFCELTDVTTGPIDFVLIGDSHAYSALPAFRDAAAAKKVRAIAITDSGCPPLIDIRPHRGDQGETDCVALNRRMVKFVAEEHPRKVFLVAYWSYYTILSQTFDDLFSGASPITDEGRIEAIGSAVERTVAAYEAGGAVVLLLAQVPRQNYNPRDIYKNAYFPWSDPIARISDLSVSRSSYSQEQSRINERLRGAIEHFIDPADLYCHSNTCLVGTVDKSYYFDQNHLSIIGSKILIETISDELIR